MNLITQGLGKRHLLVTRGLGKELVIVVDVRPKPSGGGGGEYYIEEYPKKHPFELVDTKRIRVPLKRKNINVKVNIEQVDVSADFSFVKYDRIRIIFKGLDND